MRDAVCRLPALNLPVSNVKPTVRVECPNCGRMVVYDAAHPKLTCPGCSNVWTVSAKRRGIISLGGEVAA